MSTFNAIPEPLVFNPLKHHLGFIRSFITENAGTTVTGETSGIIKELRHLGGSVMDIYTGKLSQSEICDEFLCYLKTKKLSERGIYRNWTGTGAKDFKTIFLSDGSHWIMKYYENEQRFVHFFPARFSQLTLRIKANTLKSAILYLIFTGKDYITEEDLNTARAIASLSPVRDIFDTEAITELIEMLRL